MFSAAFKLKSQILERVKIHNLQIPTRWVTHHLGCLQPFLWWSCVMVCVHVRVYVCIPYRLIVCMTLCVHSQQWSVCDYAGVYICTHQYNNINKINNDYASNCVVLTWPSQISSALLECSLFG